VTAPISYVAAIIVDLDAICTFLECQPGDILRWVPDPDRAEV
jgi:DNA-binding Xre family transcriptional regulator